MEKILNEMQETLNKLKSVLKEQKDCIDILMKEQEKKEQMKKDYKLNIENYIKYNQLKTLNDLDKRKVKENDKLYREQIQHSKMVIDEIYKKNYNKTIMNNLEGFISI
tara:strand:+ start:66 stop:389 length:324 start_codon:yes stop_codon:yes gene_type:complete